MLRQDRSTQFSNQWSLATSNSNRQQPTTTTISQPCRVYHQPAVTSSSRHRLHHTTTTTSSSQHVSTTAVSCRQLPITLKNSPVDITTSPLSPLPPTGQSLQSMLVLQGRPPLVDHPAGRIRISNQSQTAGKHRDRPSTLNNLAAKERQARASPADLQWSTAMKDHPRRMSGLHSSRTSRDSHPEERQTRDFTHHPTAGTHRGRPSTSGLPEESQSRLHRVPAGLGSP